MARQPKHARDESQLKRVLAFRLRPEPLCTRPRLQQNLPPRSPSALPIIFHLRLKPYVRERSRVGGRDEVFAVCAEHDFVGE